ncbi:hypothetical protein DSCA_00460 [Desulfosarcina alkanivorans]|uniref:Nitrogen regulation protein B n=1 Tax=Desulfosarcina alkanivorans TaxID=571177 RepID=A0A5K7YB44_9BACT|nr:ATP-binding protein [Desulfosarcina alkanivorans]BBO66116.1 hypothetical protein DSCA_00460 [Desulfosarcina alkanivorans]
MCLSDKTKLSDRHVLNFHIKAPYFQALNNAPIPVFIIREDGRFLLMNHAFQTATGYSPESIPTIEAWTEHLKGNSDDNVANRFANLFEPHKIVAPFRVKVSTADDKSLVWELFNAPLGQTVDGHRMVISIASDVTTTNVDHQRSLEDVKNRLEQEVTKRTKDLNTTILALEKEIAERKRMSDALTRSQERLTEMSRRTLYLLEADRRTVSKELHDSIGASLAAIKFSLEEKEMKRFEAHGCLDDSLEQEIAYLLATIKETKRISAYLRPTTLDDLGLMATVQWYLRQFQRMYGNIQINYKAEISEDDVPESMKIIIYRIIQEGLSNAEKHSEASSVRLHMKFEDGGHAISLFIEDDGRGFDVAEVLSTKDPLSGYGLTAMRERCEVFGGSFNIESRIGQGTKINAVLPIK